MAATVKIGKKRLALLCAGKTKKKEKGNTEATQKNRKNINCPGEKRDECDGKWPSGELSGSASGARKKCGFHRAEKKVPLCQPSSGSRARFVTASNLDSCVFSGEPSTKNESVKTR